MPYSHCKQLIPKEYDKRIKLKEEQKEEIKVKYKTGLYSQRKLATEYNVSRRLITFIIDDKKLQRQKELRKEKNYYDKDKHREYMKNHRHYKQELKLQGKLIDK